MTDLLMTEITYRLTWPGRQVTREQCHLTAKDGKLVSEADALEWLEGKHGKGAVKIMKRLLVPLVIGIDAGKR